MLWAVPLLADTCGARARAPQVVCTKRYSSDDPRNAPFRSCMMWPVVPSMEWA